MTTPPYEPGRTPTPPVADPDAVLDTELYRDRDDESRSRLAGVRDRLGEGGSRIAETSRQHPIPLALIGAGLGWLLVESTSGRSISLGRSHDDDLDEREAFSGIDDDAEPGLRDRAGQRLSAASESSRRAAREASGRLRSTGRKARLGFWQTLERHPLAMGSAALGLGLLTGLALPHSEWEDETLGERRDDLVRKAKSTGKEALDTGLEAARESTRAAAETLREGARRDEPLDERLERAAREARDRARETASGRSASGPGSRPGDPTGRRPEH